MKRRAAYVKSMKSAPSPCPNCSRMLDGITGASIGSPFDSEPKLKGKATMCAYCGAMLTFADNSGRLRVMTEAERDAVLDADPVCKQLWEDFRRRAKSPNFASKRFN